MLTASQAGYLYVFCFFAFKYYNIIAVMQAATQAYYIYLFLFIYLWKSYYKYNYISSYSGQWYILI